MCNNKKEKSSVRINNPINVVSIFAYLIGVREDILNNNYDKNVIKKLSKDRNAVIIRTLCSIRNKMLHNYEKAEQDIVYNMKSLYRQDLFKEDFKILVKYDADISKTNCRINEYHLIINSELKKRIDDIKKYVPSWLKWKYFKNLFFMPNCTQIKDVKREVKEFFNAISKYPYQVYINWNPNSKYEYANGKILLCDKNFVLALYEQHGEEFTDLSKVTDVSAPVKQNIYDFMEKNKDIEIIVDCENSNPYKLAAMLKQLNSKVLKNIKRIVLYDDKNTTKAWYAINSYSNIPVSYKYIERIKENKSLVDIKIAMGISKSYYTQTSNAFILLSSDSDFWGVISSLPGANFLIMIEREKCGIDIKKALLDNNIFYCYLDDFSTGGISDFKNYLFNYELKRTVSAFFKLNARELLESIIKELRMTDVSQEERNNFYDNVIKKMTLKIDKETSDFYIDV